MTDSISITITNFEGSVRQTSYPRGMGMSLMEMLKADGYEIAATCGGMALCATCHVNFTLGGQVLPSPTESEYEMLDTLPVLFAGSRLSCQLKIDDLHDGASIELKG